MKKLLLYLFIALPFALMGQQLPYASTFTETNFIWNPAMTAQGDYWEIAANYRQQWASFNDAPRTATASVQYPFVDNNMSVGASIIHDETHPLRFNSITFSYAYKLKLNLLHRDQLSLGLMATMSEFEVDSRSIVVNDEVDFLLPSDETSKIKPNAGAGIYYRSFADSDFDRNYFYAGVGVNQLLASKLNFDSDGSPTNLQRALHGNAVIGGRLINDILALEPTVWLNYSNKNLYNINLGVKVERYESFWAGISFSSNQTATLQAGVILKNGLLKDGLLRIGTLATYNRGSVGQYQGLGYEFYIAYRFEQD